MFISVIYHEPKLPVPISNGAPCNRGLCVWVGVLFCLLMAPMPHRVRGCRNLRKFPGDSDAKCASLFITSFIFYDDILSSPPHSIPFQCRLSSDGTYLLYHTHIQFYLHSLPDLSAPSKTYCRYTKVVRFSLSLSMKENQCQGS